MGEEILSCRQYEKQIPMYLNKTLSDEETIELIDHVKKCPSCREELTIQYLVGRGLQSLNDGNEFNLAGELDKKLSKAHARLNRLYRLNRFSWVLRTIVVIEAVILFVLTLQIWI